MSRAKLERRAVGTLLIQQQQTSRDLRKTFRQSADAEQDKPESRLRAVRRIVPALSLVLYSGRQAARSAARRRLSAELSALDVPIAGHQWSIGNRRAVDQAASDRVASSLVDQYRGIASGDVEEEARRSATQAMRARLERAARTEVARAYSEEHREAIRDVVDHDRRFRDGQLAETIENALRRRWSSLADACERCVPMDGTEVGIDDSYPGGEEPGGVHPHCSCVEYLVRIN